MENNNNNIVEKKYKKRKKTKITVLVVLSIIIIVLVSLVLYGFSLTKDSVKLFRNIDKRFDRIHNTRIDKKLDKEFNFNIQKDIIYDNNNPDYAKLDTYCVGDKDTKRPVFLYIHGGGFVAGDKYHRRGIAKWIASKGYFVVNISYSLAPEKKHKDALKDLESISKWILAHYKEYNYDLNKVVVGGDSAGAYYSLTLAALSTNKEFQKDTGLKVDLKINSTVLICGTYKLQVKNPKDKQTQQFSKRFTGYDADKLNQYKYFKALSPINYVNENFPRTFMSYAKKDIFVKGEGEGLVAKLDSLKIDSFKIYAEKLMDNHCYSLTWKGKAADKHNEELAKFLEKIKNE